MLKFNPADRITIEEALNHPFMEEYREDELDSVEAPFDFSFED